MCYHPGSSFLSLYLPPPPPVCPGRGSLSYMFHVCMLDHIALLVFLHLIYSHKHIKGTGDTARTQHTKHNEGDGWSTSKAKRVPRGTIYTACSKVSRDSRPAVVCGGGGGGLHDHLKASYRPLAIPCWT